MLLRNVHPPPVAEIAKFVRNLSAIGGGLGEAAALCVDRPSRAAEITRLLEQANAALHRATRVGPLLQFHGSFSPELKQLGVSREHMTALAGWISAPPAAGSTGSWALKYQASIDGWGANAFHRKCDGVKNLLVLCKSTSDHLFGGFTREGFVHSGGQWTVDPAAFLFTLSNPHGVPPTKLPRSGVGNDVYSNHTYGPTFGNGHALHIPNNPNTINCGTTASNSYTDPTGRGAALFTGGQHYTLKELLCFAV